MGLLQNQLKKFTDPIIKSTLAELSKAASDQPKVTEVPTQMQIGYQYTGGARRKYGSMVDFDTLRTFSVVYDVARVCINHRKRQINNLEWSIVPKDDQADKKQYKKRIDNITAFFEEPMPGMDFKTWIDKIIEDILVVDGAVLWKDRTIGGQTLGLLPIDSTTIRLKVETDGTTPIPPEIAYQQIIFGDVNGEWTTDEMYYKQMNPRTSSPYGLSALECLIIGVDAALRSQMANAALLSEGTVPEGMIALPDTWNPEQIKDYQVWFDTLLAGNNVGSSRIKFIPGGKGVTYIPTKKQDDMRMLDFEKWLLMKTCAIFDVQPSDIGFVEGMGQNLGADQQELGNQRGLVPMANYIKSFLTQIVSKDFASPDLKFEWNGLQVVDNEFELQRQTMMIEHGALTINEIRVDQGREPLQDPIADKPMVYSRSGVTPLEVIDVEAQQSIEQAKNPEPEPAGPIKPLGAEDPNADPNADGKEQAKMDMMDDAEDELRELEQWESKATKYMKSGRGVPKFLVSKIDKSAATLIMGRLQVAKSKDEVKVAFAPFKQDAQERALIKEASIVSNKISGFKRKKYEQTRSST